MTARLAIIIALLVWNGGFMVFMLGKITSLLEELPTRIGEEIAAVLGEDFPESDDK